MAFFGLGLGSTPKSKKKPQRRGQISIETLRELRCSACPLNSAEKHLSHPKMEATGASKPLIYVLGEAPGSDEDEVGIQFIGASGQILRSQIPEKYEDRIRWNNCIRCHPPKNRNPTITELECCRNFIVEDIEKAKPKAIFVFGGVPLNWLNGSDGITKWRGRYSPVSVGNHTCWAFYFLHPAYVLRTRRKGKSGKTQKSELEFAFNRDLKRAFKFLQDLPDPVIGEPLESPPTGVRRAVKANPYPNGPTRSLAPSRGASSYPDARGRTFRGVRYVTGSDPGDLDRVVEWLEYLKTKPSVAFDLETTTDEKLPDRQTRPYGEGARILSVAVAANGESFAFPIHHKQAGWSTLRRKEVEARFIAFLKNYKGVKVAHNLAFELEWLAYFYGKKLVYAGLWGDTMGQAYVLDERRGMLGLDDLTLQHFGFDLKVYFAHLNKSRLDDEDIRDVLVYNGLDSLWEHKLYLKQKKLLKQEGLWEVYQNHIPPIQTSVLTQLFGSKINFQLVNSLGAKYEAEAQHLTAKIRKYKAVKRFEEWKGKEFNPSSHAHVVDLFKVILERPECKNEETGKYSADDEVLKRIGTPLAEDIRQYRGVTGNKSKYIDPLKPEAKECIFPDGRVHSNLHIFFTKTGRTSSSFVNQQYWPKRDEEFKDLRAEFEAEDDCWMVAIDQGQIEARVIQMAAKDRRYGEYLWNRQDVHMDWTLRLAHAYPTRIGGKKFIKDKDVMKTFRTDVKNQWTFPLFFGCSSYSAARYLSMPIEVVDPLVDKFWQEFSGVKSWQEELEDFYERNGYVETLTGRRRRAPITHNELINSPIQGTASDITVSAWSRLSQAASELDMWQFQARLEIHDELVFHIPKKTFDRDLEFIVDHLLDCDHFDFINVPLAVEVNRGPNWYEQQHVMTIFSDDLGKIDRKKCGY
jgi:uracil-DNA glycosylase family 4